MPEIKVTAGYQDKGLDAGLKKAQAGLAATAVANNKLDSALDKSSRSAGAAGQALINVGRVAQDSAFGFIGIANNLNPLLESFQRLKAESGSGKAALQALGSSLIGPGGLGLALSAVTAAVSFAQIGFSAWTRGLSENKKEVDSAKNSADKFKDTLQGIYAESAKEATQAAALVAVLKNETETRERKNQALKDLKEINPEIFGQLKMEQGAVAGLDQAYQNFLSNFKNVIAAKILQSKLEEKLTRLIELQGSTLSKSEKDRKFIQDQIIANRIKDLYSKGGALAAQSIAEPFEKAADKTRKEIGALEVDIKGFQDQLTELSKGVQIDIDPEKKAKKSAETIADVIAKLKRDLYADAAIGQALGLPKPETAKKQLSEVLSAVERLIRDFKVAPSDTIIQKLLGAQGNNLFGTGLFDKLLNAEDLKKVTDKVAERIPVAIKDIGNKISQAPAINIPLKATINITDLTKQVQDQFQNLFASIGDSLAVLVNGGNPFQALFSSLFASLGQGLQELGKQAIAASELIMSIKATLGTTLGIAGGIALIALGGIIKGLAAKIKAPQFYSGGYTGNAGRRDVAGVVHGQEYVLNAAATRRIGVANLNALNAGYVPLGTGINTSGITSGGGGFVAETVLRGKDLAVVIKRANESMSRNN